MLASSYVLLSIIMVLILLVGCYSAALRFYKSKKIALDKTKSLSSFLLVYFIYLGILSYFEILTVYTLPPRFLLFLLLPFIGFSVYFFIKNKNSVFIQSIPLHWIIFYQSFRIVVEFLLLYTFLAGIIPIEATFEGHNFDIAMGVLAIPVGVIALRTGYHYKNLLRYWNIAGIAMIMIVAFTIATAVYAPSIWGYESSPVQSSFVTFPYLLLPAFLAPSAIMMHIVSLIQLRGE